MTTRLLLPFRHGVDIFAIEQAILLAKSLDATLVPLSLIQVPQERRARGARLEHIQQSKDFLEAVKYKAARYGVLVDRFEVFTTDIEQSINIVAKEQKCEGILLFLRRNKGVLLQANEIKRLMEMAACKLYVLRLQSNDRKDSVQTFRERFSDWLMRRGRRQPQGSIELQFYPEEEKMPSVEVGSRNRIEAGKSCLIFILCLCFLLTRSSPRLNSFEEFLSILFHLAYIILSKEGLSYLQNCRLSIPTSSFCVISNRKQGYECC